jgi:hypothetical protein
MFPARIDDAEQIRCARLDSVIPVPKALLAAPQQIAHPKPVAIPLWLNVQLKGTGSLIPLLDMALFIREDRSMPI